ncbi:MAG: branched-chain amino acid aminotransferase [Gammaproteobacteria bacterium]|jgi:branched-chain amino acid aminotransferase
MSTGNNWMVWLNGRIVPENEALVPIRDRGFKYGDAAFDTTRTFGHRIFKLDEHLDRFYRSLNYLRINPGVSRATIKQASEEIAELNLKNVAADEDIWLTQRVTRGIDAADRSNWPDYPQCTVLIESRPLPLRERGRFYREGLKIATSSVRRPAPDTMSPRAKTHNYLNLILAELEVKARDPDAHAVLLDTNGNLAEGKGSNLFLVKDGVLRTPKERYVLPGVSRQTTMDLARAAKMPVEEADLDLFDALNADEIFITSTSFCICPVSTVNGATIGDGQIPGPITKQLIDAYVDYVDCDWYGQYLKHSN